MLTALERNELPVTFCIDFGGFNPAVEHYVALYLVLFRRKMIQCRMNTFYLNRTCRIPKLTMHAAILQDH